MKKGGSKLRMTPLERGLACSARLEGRSLGYIEQALHRDRVTLRKLFEKRGVPVPAKNGRGRKRKFDGNQMCAIRELHAAGVDKRDLMVRFGAAKETIRRVLYVYP